MYKIIRIHFRQPSTVIRTGLSLEEAQKHCKDPESSSSTATAKEALEYTRVHGQWFDGYDEE